MRKAFSVVFWTALGMTCVLHFLVAFTIFVVTYPFDRRRLVLHLYSSFWAQTFFYFNPFWHLRVEHRERLPWRGPAVIVSNHESLGDVLVLFGLFRPFKWVSKASVFKVPFLGWNMRLNDYIPVVRGRRDSVVKMMAHCHRWLKKDVPVLMFPEGTRSFDGTMQPFKDGAFQLALEAKVPIIPIVIDGTTPLLPKHGLVLDTHANCVVRVLDPIASTGFADAAALRDHVRAVMLVEKEQLVRARTMQVA